MEETMRVLTIKELMRLTRLELCGLADEFTAALMFLAEDSPERTAAKRTLCNIRRVLRWFNLAPE
jgi:hypothetical protein